MTLRLIRLSPFHRGFNNGRIPPTPIFWQTVRPKLPVEVSLIHLLTESYLQCPEKTKLCWFLSHAQLFCDPHGLQSTKLLCPWDSLAKNTGMGCHAFLKEIVPTQGVNPNLLHYKQILYHLSHQGSSWRRPNVFLKEEASHDGTHDGA